MCNFHTIIEENKMPFLRFNLSTSLPPHYQTDLGVHTWLVLCKSESKHCGGSAQPGVVRYACPGHVRMAGQGCPVRHTRCRYNQQNQAHWLKLSSLCKRKSHQELQTVQIKTSLSLSYLEFRGGGTSRVLNKIYRFASPERRWPFLTHTPVGGRKM